MSIGSSDIKLIKDIKNGQVASSILIVDDDAFNLYALKKLIMTLGDF